MRHESTGSIDRREAGEEPECHGEEIGEGEIGGGGTGGRIRRGFGRIVRDEEGRVVRVELEEEESSAEGRPRDLMEAREEVGQPERITLGGEWVQERHGRKEGEENEVIQGARFGLRLPHEDKFNV